MTGRRPYTKQRNRHPRPHVAPETIFTLDAITVIATSLDPLIVDIEWNQVVVLLWPDNGGLDVEALFGPEEPFEVTQPSPNKTRLTFGGPLIDPETVIITSLPCAVAPVSGINPIFGKQWPISGV